MELKYPDPRLIHLEHADPEDGPIPLAEHFDGAIYFPEGTNTPVQMIEIADTAICYINPEGRLSGLLQFARCCHCKGLIFPDPIPCRKIEL